MVLAIREITEIVAAILIVWSLGHCIWLNYFRCTTDTEPYVYVQTYNDIYKFTDPILRLAHADPRAYQLVGHIIRAEPLSVAVDSRRFRPGRLLRKGQHAGATRRRFSARAAGQN